MECVAWLGNKAPLLSRKDIAMFSGLQQDFDISKSRLELGFSPKSPEQAVTEAFAYLMQKGAVSS
jgi:dihydroflavonol-4-reductase